MESSTNKAQIYDRGYRPWHGQYVPPATRILNLVRNEVSFALKSKAVWFLFFFHAFTLFFDTIIVLFYNYRPGDGIFGGRFYSEKIISLVFDNKTPDARDLYFYAMGSQMGIQDIILVVVVGGSLISKDRIHGATSLYFSRRVTKFEYFLIKFLTLSVFIATFTWLPALYKFLLVGIKLEFTFNEWVQALPFLFYAFLTGLVIMVSMSTLVLSLSSVAKRGAYVSIPLILTIPVGLFLPLILAFNFNSPYYYLFAGFPEWYRIIFGSFLGVDLNLWYDMSSDINIDVNPLHAWAILLFIFVLSALNLKKQLERLGVDER